MYKKHKKLADEKKNEDRVQKRIARPKNLGIENLTPK